MRRLKGSLSKPVKTEESMDDEQLKVSGGEAFLQVNYDDKFTMTQLIEKLASSPEAAGLVRLRIGPWEECYEKTSASTVEALSRHASSFPRLTSLYLGDIEAEQCEISWINQCDISPLLKAFPKLEVLEVRGGNGLRVSEARHAQLKKLRFESGGLPREVVQDVARGELPDLEHLEFWLGTSEYGGTVQLEDLQPLLSSDRFPKLSFLGLMNWEHANSIPGALKGCRILGQLRTLNLSMGTMTDEGGGELLKIPELKALQTLDLDDNYMSDELIQNLRSTLGACVQPGNQDVPDEYEYNGVKYSDVYCSVAE